MLNVDYYKKQIIKYKGPSQLDKKIQALIACIVCKFPTIYNETIQHHKTESKFKCGEHKVLVFHKDWHSETPVGLSLKGGPPFLLSVIYGPVVVKILSEGTVVATILSLL